MIDSLSLLITCTSSQSSSSTISTFILTTNMTLPQSFSSGLVQAPFLASSGLLLKVWRVTSSHDEAIVSYSGNGLFWKVYEDSGLTVVFFEVNPGFGLQPNLVSSSDLKKNNFNRFEFLCTRKSPDFSVNKSAVDLFSQNFQRLDELKGKIKSSTRLIISGSGVGGAVASLFTISLLESIGSAKRRPLCITFGSPLIGDKKLQQVISSSSNWMFCFLHVVSLKDPLPRLFISQTSAYIPFGTFFFCSDDANSTCFESPDTILDLLNATGSIQTQNQGFQSADYGKILEKLKHKVICKDFSTRVENMANEDSELASSSLQFQALGLTHHFQQQNIDTHNLETKIRIQEKSFIYPRTVLYSPAEKLNHMKVSMAHLEWYKMAMKDKRIGYYDSYKNMISQLDYDVIPSHKKLTNYWEKMVQEIEMMPQREGTASRRRWLFGGTIYRRMVEPLAIAEYYRKGGKDYVTQNRSKHFVLLEKWFNEMENGNEEDICDLDYDWDWECILKWRRNVDDYLPSSHGLMVDEEMEDNSVLNIRSDYENEELPSSVTGYTARVDQLLLSSYGLNDVQEEEENLNTSSKNNQDNSSCYKACVDELLLSCQGSVKAENIHKFGSYVDQALLSRQGTFAVRDLQEILNTRKKKDMHYNLTLDSCFWAHVEEALISCKELRFNKEKEETLQKLVDFDEYVYGLLENYQVSSEIFLQKSSYMCWWNEYKAIKGTSYDSKLAKFMNDDRYCEQYGFGDYDFPLNYY